MHHVRAVDVDRGGDGAVGQRMRTVEGAALYYLLWHHLLVPVAEVHEPGVDGPAPLQKPSGELLPVVPRDDPGDPVSRQDAVLPRGIARQGKGGPELAKLLVGPQAPLDYHPRS